LTAKRLYVFAGSYQEARDCIKAIEWDSDNWTYISEYEVLKGVWRPDVIYTGSFMLREDREEIEKALDEREAKRALIRQVLMPAPKSGTRRFIYDGGAA